MHCDIFVNVFLQYHSRHDCSCFKAINVAYEYSAREYDSTDIDILSEQPRAEFQKAGIRKYWIIDPFQKVVTVFKFASPQASAPYRFDESVSSSVLDGLYIIMDALLKEY